MNILSHFNYDELNIINLIKKECLKHNRKAYLVGGVVRDFLLNKKPRDIDICIECNPIDIIKKIDFVKEYKYYEKFQTSTITFKNGVILDLIRCRKEEYEFPGALPNIIPSNIYDDLYRRDFTINAIGYDIVNNKIIDPYNGVADLRNRIVKKVHIDSYNEDPTRIFRAIKYANRYNFYINDLYEIRECIDAQVFNTISSDRIVREILIACSETNWIKNILMYNELGILEIDLNLFNIGKKIYNYTCMDDRLINLFISMKNKNHRQLLINNSVLKKELKSAFRDFENLIYKLDRLLHSDINNFNIYNILSRMSDTDIKLISFNKSYKYLILNYIKNMNNISLNVTGKDLINLGIKKGKQYREILKRLLLLKLNTGILNEKQYLYAKLGEIVNVNKHKN